MTVSNNFWRTFSFQNKKMNGFLLFAIIFLSGFIGIYGIIIPSLQSGSLNDNSALDRGSGSNSGYEELIRVNIDKYGNLSVQGSFQGPQVTPPVNWALPEYDSIWNIWFSVCNPRNTAYFHRYMVQTLNPRISLNDVYLFVMFPVEGSQVLTVNPLLPVLTTPEMQTTAAILKEDIENAFGIQNNFSTITIEEYYGLGRVIIYGFNFTAQVDYNYFIQYFKGHLPSGLGNSFSAERINDTNSWITWIYSNCWTFSGTMQSTIRNPLGDYDSFFDVQISLQYPRYFGAGYTFGDYSRNLSSVLDAPFEPLVVLNQSAYASSEIDIVVENGNITSSSASPYHIPRNFGLDDDYWWLLRSDLYGTSIDGSGTLADIQVNFRFGLVNMTVLSPPPTPQKGNVAVNVFVETDLTFAFPALIAQVYDEATFYQRTFDDAAYSSFFSPSALTSFTLIDMLMTGNFVGTWEDTYGYPNGNYYIYFFSYFPELSLLTPRTKYSGSMGGLLYGYAFVQLNNPNQIHINVSPPQPHEALIKSVPVVANVSSPAAVKSVEYFVYNYSSFVFQGGGPNYIFGENLTLTGGTVLNGIWSGALDTTRLRSTYEYMLYLKVTDANGTFYEDVPILVNNTFYQENIPIYAPMGSNQQEGYDLFVGTEITPSTYDPYNYGGGGPSPHMFYGFGVDFGMDFNSQLYKDILYVLVTADDPSTRNPLIDLIKYGLPESDCMVTILTQGSSPQTIAAILEKAKTAFNIPTLTPVAIEELSMGPGMPVSVLIYGYNYSVINYPNFITKVHNSVPSGLADIYNIANMTQMGVQSSILFGWVNPAMFMLPSQYRNYNFGQGAFISPTIQFSDYFNSTIGTQWTVSLHDLFPQISQFKACAPTVASVILSGFGTSIFSPYGGAITLNSNITAWYPQDPWRINVTALYGYVNPNFLNLIRFTMLNTTAAPYGLRTTDDIRFRVTGPYVTNQLLSPLKDQSIELDENTVTITTQSLNGTWDRIEYKINTLDGRTTVAYGNLFFNGANWTNVIHSLNIMPGQYSLITHCTDQIGNWALNGTVININNSASSSNLGIFINELGDVEIGFGIVEPALGYGMQLGINKPLYNLTDLQAIMLHFGESNTPFGMCTATTGKNWNVFLAMIGASTTTEDVLQTISEPLIADLERVFNITGMLKQQEVIRSDAFGASPGLVWTMNYTAQRDYNYFLDHYETVRKGNITEIVSKENLLKANQSFIHYNIYPDHMLRWILPFFGIPQNANIGEGTFVGSWMRFMNVYDYSAVNKQYQFSLAQFLGIQQLNAIAEYGLTFSNVRVNTYVASGYHMGVYPNITPYTTYLGFSGNLDKCGYLMLNKSGNTVSGINITNDIRFNFTAPYTTATVVSPLPGSPVHGDVDLKIMANAEKVPITRAEAAIYPISAFSVMPSNQNPIATVSLQLDRDFKTWIGTWESLDVDLPNGWYDIIFTVYDNDTSPRFTRTSTTVYLYNTYYSENLGVVVEQNGNTSVSFQIQGNGIKTNLDYSTPAYQEVVLTSFAAFNAYSGHTNYSKSLFGDWLQMNDIDFGLSIMFHQDISDADALLFADSIKDDYERAFGVEGRLNYIGIGVIAIPMGSEPLSFKSVAFGNKYDPTLTYDYFIKMFHRQVPSGVNNSFPSSTLKGTDSYLQWVNFIDKSIANMGNPPTMEQNLCMIMGKLFYPQYFGTGYMGDKLQEHTLSLIDLLNISQFVHASDDVADSMISNVNFLVENANITRWFPDVPGATSKSGGTTNNYYATPAERSYYQSWEDKFGNRIYSFSNWADINITFEEPITRPRILSPLPGAVIDGLTNVSVFVQNNTLDSINSVKLRVYTEAEYANLVVYKIMGPGSTMPQARPDPPDYVFYMNNMGGGIWNYTWAAYVLPDGPIWLDVLVQTESQLYSYNSTRVIISNSAPLAVNALSPANGTLVSGSVELSAQVINSTQVSMVVFAVFDLTLSTIYGNSYLVYQGGNIYSGTWFSHATPNGTYVVAFALMDENGAMAFNYSTIIQVANPQLFEIELLQPVSTLARSPNANIIAVGTGPYPVALMEYSIYQVYYDPNNRYWQNTGYMASGMMEDPNSVWVASFDSTAWEDRVLGFDSNFYDAYYEIEIIATDLTGTQCEFVDRFPLTPMKVPRAEIISPTPYAYCSGIFNITVSVTNLTDALKDVFGEIRRSDGKVMATLTFTLSPNRTLAAAPCFSYMLPNDYYTIAVWGTTDTGAFYDTGRFSPSNYVGFSVEIRSPSQWEITKGTVTIQLAIENYTRLDSINAFIMVEWGYSSISLPGFQYNITSGFWELPWATSLLPDGNYRIECRVRDINNFAVEAVRHILIDNPPSVIIMSPLMGSIYAEYEPIYIDVFIPNGDVRNVELWGNGTYIMDLNRTGGANWGAVWSNTIGWAGTTILQIRAYDLRGNVNDTQLTWVTITLYIPPENQADLYEVKTLNFKGDEQTLFTRGETVDYHSIIRGDIGGNTYVVTAQTDDSLLQGYLTYNETVTVLPGQDIEVFFSYDISSGAPLGIYTVQVIVWTDWPWNGGLCVDFITITFEVR